MNTPKQNTQALADVLEVLDDIRLADSHPERLAALDKAQKMVFTLWNTESVDSEQFEDLKLQLLVADGEGVRRIEAKTAESQ